MVDFFSCAYQYDLNCFPLFQGTYLLNKAVSQAIVENKLTGGSIINMSSIVGKVNKIFKGQ